MMKLLLILAMALLAGCAKKPQPEVIGPSPRADKVPTMVVLDTSAILIFDKDTVMESAIYFALNSDSIDTFAGWGILGIVDYLRLTTHRIHLVGYACPLGDAGYNYDLGMRRALAVEVAMIDSGIAQDRITVTSRGEDFPITLEPRQYGKNRRVEYSFQEKDK